MLLLEPSDDIVREIFAVPAAFGPSLDEERRRNA
jgi:hypothetical protein